MFETREGNSPGTELSIARIDVDVFVVFLIFLSYWHSVILCTVTFHFDFHKIFFFNSEDINLKIESYVAWMVLHPPAIRKDFSNPNL